MSSFRSITVLALGVGVVVWHAGARIYRFDLQATPRAPRASGVAQLTLAWSPFGVAVSADGHLVYHLDVEVAQLGSAARLGAQGYVVWVVSPNLDRVEHLGVLSGEGRLRGRLSSWNKFLLLVTAEPDTSTAQRAGPILLQGRSPSGLMASFASHELYNLMPH